MGQAVNQFHQVIKCLFYEDLIFIKVYLFIIIILCTNVLLFPIVQGDVSTSTAAILFDSHVSALLYIWTLDSGQLCDRI